MAVTVVPDVEEESGVESGAEPLGAGADEAEPEAEEMPVEEPKPPRLLQEPLPGDWTEISGEFGGDAPTVSEIRLMGGSLPIEGSFTKGTELQLLVTVRVSEVHGVDVLDGWGNSKRTIRRHRARLTSVRRYGK
jgi:hypothetical protein